MVCERSSRWTNFKWNHRKRSYCARTAPPVSAPTLGRVDLSRVVVPSLSTGTSVCMSVFVCPCVCPCVYARVYVRGFTCTCVCTCVGTCLYMCVYVRVYMFVCVYVLVCPCALSHECSRSTGNRSILNRLRWVSHTPNGHRNFPRWQTCRRHIHNY